MITKNGDICYRSHTSRCQRCVNYIGIPYVCKWHKMIPYRIWEFCISYECSHFKSIVNDLISHHVFRDYSDELLFPEKKFGQGKYRFNSAGEIIGKL